MSTATRTKPKPADAPAVSPPPEPAEPVMLTAALANKALERRNAIHKFSLPATAALLGIKEMTADVRVPDLGDPDILMNLPDPLLRTILTAVNAVEEREGTAKPVDLTKPDEIDFAKAKRDAHRNRALIDAYVVAGFVDPPVAFTEEDQKTTAYVLISAIHPNDRTQFFNWCQNRYTEAAATVETFPDRPAEGVAIGRSGGVDGAASERSAEAQGSGAQ